eukprot:794863-Rhodomonas_salina.1
MRCTLALAVPHRRLELVAKLAPDLGHHRFADLRCSMRLHTSWSRPNRSPAHHAQSLRRGGCLFGAQEANISKISPTHQHAAQCEENARVFVCSQLPKRCGSICPCGCTFRCICCQLHQRRHDPLIASFGPLPDDLVCRRPHSVLLGCARREAFGSHSLISFACHATQRLQYCHSHVDPYVLALFQPAWYQTSEF